jgi:putative hydrolase of the HAD superfamily
MKQPNVIVFDLDDTLCLERDFALSGFRAAAVWFQKEMGIEGLEKICLARFNSGQRTKIFNDAVGQLDVTADRKIVERLVDVYRKHSPDISLTEDSARYFDNAPGNRRHALITDGQSSTQMAKVRSLGLDRLLDCIIYTGDWGPEYWKPHPRSFETIERQFGLNGHSLVYIADNPVKDFVTPKARGWWTIQIVRPERVHLVSAPSEEHRAHGMIGSLDVLEDCLNRLKQNHSSAST